MKVKTLLAIAAVAAGVFGIGLLFAPEQFMGSYGITLDGVSLLFARSMAAFLLAMALINWRARGSADAVFIKTVVLANIIIHAITLVLDYGGTTSGLINTSGWGAVAMHGFFVLGFGYFYFRKASWN